MLEAQAKPQTTSITLRLNVSAGFGDGEIFDRLDSKRQIPRTGTLIWKMKICNRETSLGVDVLVKPANYHLRIQADICRLHFCLAGSLWGWGDYLWVRALPSQ